MTLYLEQSKIIIDVNLNFNLYNQRIEIKLRNSVI